MTVTKTDEAVMAVSNALHDELRDLTGKPIAFVLIVFDGNEHGVTSNSPPDLMVSMMTQALERLQTLQPEIEAARQPKH